MGFPWRAEARVDRGRCRSPLTSWLLAVGMLLGSSPIGPATWAAGPASNPFQATNSDDARQAAIQSIPMDRFDAATQSKVRGVLNSVTVFRRLPVRIIDCDPDLYLFLVRHPDVVVNIWEALGATQVQLRQQGEGFYRLSDTGGTQGFAQMLYDSPTMHVFYSEGTYKGPLAPRPVHGRCLLLLRSGYVREADGRSYITTRLESFLSIDPGAIELLTKTFEPLVGKIADANFTQTVTFVGNLSRTAEANPRGVQRLSTRLAHVQPEHRQRLAELAEQLGAHGEAGQETPPNPPATRMAERERVVE